MRLSEFKDEKGIEVVGRLLEVLPAIVSVKENRQAVDQGVVRFASSMLRNTPKETKKLLAIMADKDPDQYECNAATVMFDIINIVSDPTFLQLFGFQSQTPTSSGSVSENTEVEAVQSDSSNIVSPDTAANKKAKPIKAISQTA